ncbi:MAG: homoserine dehydrogenase [Vicinamibacterales bacterium]
MGLSSFQTSGNSPGSRGITPCRVGLLGLSTVGFALAGRLTDLDSPPSLQLTHICDRRAREKRLRQPDAFPGDSIVWLERHDDLLTSDVDVIVEAVGGTEPAGDYLRAALLTGKSVVTANRLVMAHHGPALMTLAERQGRQVRFEAAVGGAMPLARLLHDGMAGDTPVRIDAILNGTSNAVLSSMEERGCVMDEAVADACAHGYPEADPNADLDGVDAAAKLAIVCALAFGLRVAPAQIDTRSILRLTPDDLRAAERRGGTIRQMAHASYQADRGALTVWVAPAFVPEESLFARTRGAGNAAAITGRRGSTVTVTGTGAGTEALAGAMLADLVTIARDRTAVVPAPVLVEPASIQGLGDRQLAEAV